MNQEAASTEEMSQVKNELENIKFTLLIKENEVIELKMMTERLECELEVLYEENSRILGILKIKDTEIQKLIERKEAKTGLFGIIQEFQQKQSLESNPLLMDIEDFKMKQGLSGDIKQISNDVDKLKRIVESIVKEETINQKVLLRLNSFDTDKELSLVTDLEKIKRDLRYTLTLILDLHAEHCGSIVCTPQ